MKYRRCGLEEEDVALSRCLRSMSKEGAEIGKKVKKKRK